VPQGQPRDLRRRLVELLREKSFERRRVVLASGAESDFFIDCKQTVLTAEGHALVGELMLTAVRALDRAELVAGVELGGCPLASAVSLTSFLREGPGEPRLDAVYVRKDAKDHGTKKLVEGDRAMPRGARVALLEDVVTTGGSTLKAVDKLRSLGAEVVGVVALVDRLEGGGDTLRAAGLPFVALCTRGDFMRDLD
jgi:orotate phosphoribosyltransferase